MIHPPNDGFARTPDPDADRRLLLDTDMHCGACYGLGVVTETVHLGGTLWLVRWLTQHTAGCAGLGWPERDYVMDAAALDAGDGHLPGVPGPGDELPVLPERCRATATSTGRRCRNLAGPGGLCDVHRGRP